MQQRHIHAEQLPRSLETNLHNLGVALAELLTA